MRVVFMGSPGFALPSLESLYQAGHDIALVVSQPDRPAGRGRKLAPPPVARFAMEKGLPLYQPRSLKSAEELMPVQQARPDMVVVAAFARLLPSSILSMPPLGCINVHPSLLPRHRGPAPVQGALLAGNSQTGVTIMLLEQTLDTGPILAQRATDIRPNEDAGMLTARLASMGAELLLETLPPWASGAIVPVPQDHSQATYTRKVRTEDAEINWHEHAETICRKVRAYAPWPGAYTFWEGRRLKVLLAVSLPPTADSLEPGEVHLAPVRPGGEKSAPSPAVSTGSGSVALLRLALEGRNAVDGAAFLRGYRSFPGSRLSIRPAHL